MLHGKEVYRSVELTDDVQTSALSVSDQLRLITANMSNDEAAELDKNEKVSVSRLNKIAALKNFLDQALERMQDLGESSVTMKMISEWKPYIESVFDGKRGYGRYYKYKILSRDVPSSVKHYFLIKVWKK